MSISRHLAGALAAAICTSALSACQAAESDATQICVGFVIGNRSNSLPVTKETIRDLIPPAEELAAGSTIVMTGVSGSVDGVLAYTGVVEHSDNSYDLKSNRINTWTEAVSSADALRADEPQADLLGAVEATARILNRTGLECTLRVLDSGLQTAGLLHFQEGLLERDPADVVSAVPRATTLEGIAVEFLTLGDVAAPQPALDSRARESLTAIWKGVIDARGGTWQEPSQVHLAVPGATPTGLPPVDVVEVSRDTIEFTELEPTCTPSSTTWQLPGDVLFSGDDDVLSPEGKRLLEPAAEILSDHPEATARLVGHSASTDGTPRVTVISDRRAEAVRAHLVSLGLPGTQITATGVGDTQPLCEDWDPATGQQIEACAVQERRVDLVVEGIELCE